jgi:hypothetical protein
VNVDPALTSRQRTPPPIDRWHARRGPAAGGYDFAPGRTLARGYEDELAREDAGYNDRLLMRDRWPWYHREERSGVGNGWVDWSAAGPPRPELHMRNATWRPEAGSSSSRFPYVPGSPTGGMHTMHRPGVARTMPRYVTTPQMRGVRTDRLTASRSGSRTYSQTTRMQGRQ